MEYNKDHYYCGPQWWPKFMRRWLSQKFNYECYLHDRDYENPDMSRAQSDYDFLAGMRTKATGDRGDRAIATIYGNTVRAFGWLAKLPRRWM